MMRRRKRQGGDIGANLDSLMDILTCSVGVMFVVVILAVTQARGTSVRVRLPLVQEPPDDVERVLLLCRWGEIRPLRIDRWLGNALTIANQSSITYNSLPRVVDKMNASVLEDPYFTYRFEMRESERGYYQRQRFAHIVINEKVDTPIGVTMQSLRADPQALHSLLQGLDPEKYWISFQVDAESIAIFREARTMVAELGFASGWDPAEWSFPLRETVLGGGPSSGGPRAGAEVQ